MCLPRALYCIKCVFCFDNVTISCRIMYCFSQRMLTAVANKVNDWFILKCGFCFAGNIWPWAGSELNNDLGDSVCWLAHDVCWVRLSHQHRHHVRWVPQSLTVSSTWRTFCAYLRRSGQNKMYLFMYWSINRLIEWCTLHVLITVILVSEIFWQGQTVMACWRGDLCCTLSAGQMVSVYLSIIEVSV